MNATADRSLWPAQAVAIAESVGIPEGALFYRDIPHPPATAYDDAIELPRLTRAQKGFVWLPWKVQTKGRTWIYAVLTPRMTTAPSFLPTIKFPNADPMKESAA